MTALCVVCCLLLLLLCDYYYFPPSLGGFFGVGLQCMIMHVGDLISCIEDFILLFGVLCVCFPVCGLFG